MKKSERLVGISLLCIILFSVPTYVQLKGSSSTNSLPLSNASALDNQNTTIYNSTSSVPAVPEALVTETGSITRSFSFPLLQLLGNTQVNLTQTITWSQNGTTLITDTFGDALSFSIPSSDGRLTLLQNSTTIDQKVTGQNVNYDIYWKPVKNANGFVDKYKFVIAGTSPNGYTIKFKVSSPEKFDYKGTSFIVGKSISSNTGQSDTVNSTKGIGIDWSDAESSGYQMKYDSDNKSINLIVGKSFYIDPTIINTISVAVSPGSTDYYEGERRVYALGGGIIYAFYYDGNTIKYVYSNDYGQTWSASFPTTTGVIASDYNRWTLVSSNLHGVNYITLLYYTVTGGNTNFYSLRGTVTGDVITWASSPGLLGSFNGNTNPFASVVASTDTNNNIYAALKVFSGGYLYTIVKSSDNGLTWTQSLPLPWVNSNSGYRIEMAMTKLASGKMLFAYTTYGTIGFTYRVYHGTSWDTVESQTPNGSGMGISVKQISSDSDSGQTAYIAYVTGGLNGALEVAKWNNDGTFSTYQQVDSTLSHSLPSITISNNINHIYTISSGKVYETHQITTWTVPSNPFGTLFNTPDELTAGISDPSALWVENGGSPLKLQFGGKPFKFQVDTSGVANSPAYTDYYEGEKRVVAAGATIFAFYYDGTNIVYKTSTDNGNTWSQTPTSTGVGTIAGDNYRWTVTSTTISNVYHIAVLYYTSSGSTYTFYSRHGTFDPSVMGSTISWDNSQTVFPSVTSSGAAAAVGATASDGSVYAAFRYVYAGTYVYAIYKSTNGGMTWNQSLGQFSSGSGYRIEMALTPLANGKMLFAYAKYESTEFTYRVCSGSSCGNPMTTGTPSAGLTASTVKQISATSDLYGNALIAFNTANLLPNSRIGIAEWASDGTWVSSVVGAYSLTNSLPSLTRTTDGNVELFTLSNGIVSETTRDRFGLWNNNQNPESPFGSSFSSPNEITAGIDFESALWMEGTSLFAGAIPSPNTYTAVYDSSLGPIPVILVHGSNDFVGSTPSAMTTDLQSIISIAGYNTATGAVTGNYYQGDIRLAPDNTVENDAQWDVNTNHGGCFSNNSCPILDNIQSLNYVDNSIYFSQGKIKFEVDAYDKSGTSYQSITTYDPSMFHDTSNEFVAGIQNEILPNYATHWYKFLQFGTESDGDTLNWQAHQYNMYYELPSGSRIDLGNLNGCELTSSPDPFWLIQSQLSVVNWDSSITYGTSGPVGVGYSQGHVQGQYTSNHSGTQPGDVTWWRGPAIIKPGTQLWGVPNSCP